MRPDDLAPHLTAAEAVAELEGPPVTRLDVTDGIAVLTLARPEAGNAMTMRLCLEIVAALDAVDADDEVRAVVLTGEGRHFCVGADLDVGFHSAATPSPHLAPYEAAAGRVVAPDGVVEPRDPGGYVTLRMAASLKPVVGAVNGAAVGAGASMVLPADVRVLGESTRLGFVFARRGLATESVAAWFLPRVVGITRATEWVLTGRLVPAAEADAAGLATRVVPDAEVLSTALAIAREIAEHTAPVAVATARQLLWGALSETSPWAVHRTESATVARFPDAGDVAEGVASFLERRPPRFPLRVPRDHPPYVPRWPQEERS
ncbi:enoyl-CoA hydratase-related protein [Nocardioides zeae]|uniref:Enoyl-CoA hydratase n=1 Tax=Nocardioides zeae TaxID=1457234 RepID=A0A6P0HHW9_9ACTN|nr:enoyl-CoA hydratase-related protein [Nocardioides zeae]NEN77890.1 enoyl-CoA hydratase [Nocardioides zeae]